MNFWGLSSTFASSENDIDISLAFYKSHTMVLVTREKLYMAKDKPQQIGMTTEINSIPSYSI
jgi:hypothetical protein